MKEEVKIRLTDYKAMEQTLERLGAKFSKEVKVTDTYFNQPDNHVKKITEDDEGNFLVELVSKDGKWQIQRYEKIADMGKQKQQLTDEFGIKRVLNKKRRFFHLSDWVIDINLIDGIGDFLIVEGENLSPKLVAKKLEIESPEFVTESFDNL